MVAWSVRFPGLEIPSPVAGPGECCGAAMTGIDRRHCCHPLLLAARLLRLPSSACPDLLPAAQGGEMLAVSLAFAEP